MNKECRLSCSEDRPSPFGKIIILDWYDGIVSCVARCESCQIAYRCTLVAWSRDHDLRVYVCHPLGRGVFECVEKKFAVIESPRWPVWAPFAGGKPDTTSNDDIYAMDDLLDTNLLPAYAIASDDLGETLKAGRELTDEAADLFDLMMKQSRERQIEEMMPFEYLIELEIVALAPRTVHAFWFSYLGMTG